jgi:hypothetical protein
MTTVKFHGMFGDHVSDISIEDYDAAYALWKMGTPIGVLATRHEVDDWELEYMFESRQHVEDQQGKLKAPKTN